MSMPFERKMLTVAFWRSPAMERGRKLNVKLLNNGKRRLVPEPPELEHDEFYKVLTDKDGKVVQPTCYSYDHTRKCMLYHYRCTHDNHHKITMFFTA